MERLSMRQSDRWAKAETITVDVKLSSESDTHSIYGTIYIKPEGKSQRYASHGECTVRLQDRFLGYWRTIESIDNQAYGALGHPATDPYGSFLIVRSPRLEPGQYRITAQHKESGAEYGREFQVKDDFSTGDWSARITVNEGSSLPPTFSQTRPGRGIAIPGVKRWPLEYPGGYSGTRTRSQSGYTNRTARV